MNKKDFIKAYNLECYDNEFIDNYYLWNECTGDKVKKCLYNHLVKIMLNDECYIEKVKKLYQNKNKHDIKKILKYYIYCTLDYCLYDECFNPLLEQRYCNNFNSWYRAKAYGYDYYFKSDDIYEVFVNSIDDDFNEIKQGMNINYYKTQLSCLVGE